MKSNARIGFVVYQNVVTDDVASTRFRVTWAVEHMENTIVTEDENELSKCDVVVFQTRFNNPDIELAQRLKNKGIKIISDFTDPHWCKEYDPYAVHPNLTKIVELSDVITLPTEEIADLFNQTFKGKQVEILKDRLNLDIYSAIKLHTFKSHYKIVWHGSYGNIPSIDLARKALERLAKEFNLTLICVYDKIDKYKVKPIPNIQIECREWSTQEVIDSMLESDISINPKYDNWKSYKSNNKTILAWSLGLMCIERDFYNEIKKYLSDDNLRNSEAKLLRQVVEQEYNVKETARQWIDIAEKLTAKQIKKNNNIVVYTAICGGFDGLREDQYKEDGIDYCAFIDRNVKSYTWNIRPFYSQFIDPVRDAKIFKVMPWQYFDCEYSIWMDGTIAIKSKPSELINKFLDGYDIAIFKHAARDCIYNEYIVDMQYRKREPLILREWQREKYIKEGIPEHVGLWECGIIIRRHTDKVKKLCQEWWGEITAFTSSDQCSFARTVYKNKIKINPITPGDMYANPYFNYIQHSKTWAYTVDDNLNNNTNLEYDNIIDTQKIILKCVSKETFYNEILGRMNTNESIVVNGAIAKYFIKNYPGQFIIFDYNKVGIDKYTSLDGRVHHLDKSMANSLEIECKVKKIAFIVLDDITPGVFNNFSLRARNVAKYIYGTEVNSSRGYTDSCGAIIYQNRFEPHDIEYARANKNKKILILDLSEAWWENTFKFSTDNLKYLCVKMISTVDAVVVPNDSLAKLLRDKFHNIRVEIIEDSLDLQTSNNYSDSKLAAYKYIKLINELSGN